MDADEKKAREYEFEHFKQAAFYGSDRFVKNDIHLDQKNVDYIIAKAEEQRKAGMVQDHTRTASSPQKNVSVFHSQSAETTKPEHDEPLL